MKFLSSTVLLLFCLLTACSNSDFSGDARSAEAFRKKCDPQKDPKCNSKLNPPTVPPPVPPVKPPTDEKLTSDDGGSVKTPGLPVIKLGIGFNDGLGYKKDDKDFNDAVVCFEGPFTYDATKKEIYSPKKQTVPVLIGSFSACTNNVIVEITPTSGEAKKYEFQTNINKRVNLDFTAGSKMSVSFKGTHKVNACPNLPTNGSLIPHANTDWVVIDLDKCRNYGN
jgi:hypothetical protein